MKEWDNHCSWEKEKRTFLLVTLWFIIILHWISNLIRKHLSERHISLGMVCYSPIDYLHLTSFSSRWNSLLEYDLPCWSSIPWYYCIRFLLCIGCFHSWCSNFVLRLLVPLQRSQVNNFPSSIYILRKNSASYYVLWFVCFALQILAEVLFGIGVFGGAYVLFQHLELILKWILVDD